MKSLLLVSLVFVSSSVLAESSSILFSDKFETKIKALESYTVTYNEPGKARAPKQKKDESGLELKLLPKKS